MWQVGFNYVLRGKHMAECFAKSKLKIFVEQNMLCLKEGNRPFVFQMFVQFEKCYCISPVSMTYFVGCSSLYCFCSCFQSVHALQELIYKINLTVILCHHFYVTFRLLIFLTYLINVHLAYLASY